MKKAISLIMTLVLVMASLISTSIVSAADATWEEFSYRWDFNGNLNEKDGKNNLALSTEAAAGVYTFTEAGQLDLTKGNADFTFAKPITLRPEQSWTIEWKALVQNNYNTFFGADTNTADMIFLGPKYPSEANPIKIFYGDGTGKNATVIPSFANGALMMTDDTIVWKIVNDPQTKTVSLLMNGKTISTVTNKYMDDNTYTRMFGIFGGTNRYFFKGLVDYVAVTCSGTSAVNPVKSVKSYSYEWNFNGNLNEANGKNKLTLNPYFTTEAYTFKDNATISMATDTTAFDLEKPIVFDSEANWTLEWRGYVTNYSLLMGNNINPNSTVYIAHNVSSYKSLRVVGFNGVVNQFLYGDNINAPTVMNTWKIVNDPAAKKIVLYLNGTQINEIESTPFTSYYTSLFGSNAEGAGKTYSYAGEVDYIKVSFEEITYAPASPGGSTTTTTTNQSTTPPTSDATIIAIIGIAVITLTTSIVRKRSAARSK